MLELFLRPVLLSAALSAALCVLARLAWPSPAVRPFIRIAATALGAYAAYVEARFQDWLPSITSRVDQAVFAIPLGALLGAWAVARGRRSWTWWAAAALCCTWIGVALHDLPRFGLGPRAAGSALLAVLVIATSASKGVGAEAAPPTRTFGLWIALAATAAVGPRAMTVSVGQLGLAILAGSVVAGIVLRGPWAPRPLPEGPMLAMLLGAILLGAKTYSSLPLAGLLLIAAAPVAESILQRVRLPARLALGIWLPATAALLLAFAGVVITEQTNPGWNLYA
jgi:hypothetical protein